MFCIKCLQMFQSFIVLKVYEFIFDLANSQFLKHFNVKGNKFLGSWINLLFDNFHAQDRYFYLN